VNERGLLCVGGRLKKSTLNCSYTHPVLLPKEGYITKLMITWCHQQTAHSGRGMTLNEVRSKGFWVIRGNSAVKQIISRCVECKRFRGTACQQKMGDLPSDRLHEAAPFTYVGLDLFGPFIVKNGRKELKRYEIIFTCLSCRAAHLEVVSSMSTDSFILALRRFIARKGNVRVIRCDNATNFVGGESELRKAFCRLDHTKLNLFLSNLGTDWLIFRKNPPSASHMGGV